MNTILIIILLLVAIYLSGCVATYFVTKEEYDVNMESGDSLPDFLTALFISLWLFIIGLLRWMMILSSWIGFIYYIISKYKGIYAEKHKN